MTEPNLGEQTQGQAVDDRAQNRKRAAKKRLRVRRDTVLRQLLAYPEGRAFLWDLVGECNVFAQTLDTTPSGHAVMSYAEGRRSIGLHLFLDIQRLSPENYFLMTKENSGAKLEDETDDGPTDQPDASAPTHGGPVRNPSSEPE